MNILNTKDIAQRLRKHTHYVQWLCKYGLIETLDYGRGYFATEDALAEFIQWSKYRTLRNKKDIIREALKKGTYDPVYPKKN